MNTHENFDGMTVMLDLDVLDTSDDGCPECGKLDDRRRQTGVEITWRR